jgi:inner membrane protein
MIGANFPDLDVVAVFFENSVHWRRGHTHGFLAMAILPFVLAWIMRAWDRGVRLRRNPGATPADFRQLTILSALAIWTHPTLDFMNTYGMRWLMPFLNRWFYADGLFIIDLWVLLALVAGVYASKRTGLTAPARAALGFLAVYTIVSLGITQLGRNAVQARFPGTRIMVAPVAVVPWERSVVIDDGTEYRTGWWSFFRGVEVAPPTIPIGDTHPAVALAKRDRNVARYLVWARFPYYRVSREGFGDGARTVVHIVDARYGAEWASITVRLP